MENPELIDVRALLSQPGSAHGIHTYINKAKCMRRVQLDALSKADGASEEAHSRDVGTVFHKLAELHHSGGCVDSVPREDPGGEIYLTGVLAEAWRLFEFYRGYAPPDAWGKVLGTELLFEMELEPGLPLTGRFDLLIDLHDLTAPYLCGMVSATGVYALDFKTHKAKPSNLHLRESTSLQYTGYQTLARAKGLDIKGVLAHHLVRHKKLTEGSVTTVFIPPPSSQEVDKLVKFLKWCKGVEGLNGANVTACFDYGVCPHLLSNRCERE